MTDLRPFLARGYAALARSTEPYKKVAADLAAAMADDPDLTKAAKARMAELVDLEQSCGGELERRCYASAKHLQILRAAMASPAKKE